MQFRRCVHHARAGDDIVSLVAAIRGEVCEIDTDRPPTSPEAVFARVADVIGSDRLLALWAEYRRSPTGRDPRRFPGFLAASPEGRKWVALGDLGRLDLAVHLAAQPHLQPSLGSCCLPDDLIESHPQMAFRFQPSLRYLGLAFPVHAWAIPRDHIASAMASVPTLLKVSPAESGVRIESLGEAIFSFESSLARGVPLSAALQSAELLQPRFEGKNALKALIELGAIADVVLHPTIPQIFDKGTTNHDYDHVE